MSEKRSLGRGNTSTTGSSSSGNGSGNGSNGGKSSSNGNGNGNGGGDSNGSDESQSRLKMVSKTTFKLRSLEDDAKEAEEKELSLALMEVPLSPTTYSPPPGSPGCDPPTPLQAENQIQDVLDRLRMDCNRTRHTRSTEIEPCYLLPPGMALWPKYSGRLVDKATAMNVENGEAEVTSQAAVDMEVDPVAEASNGNGDVEKEVQVDHHRGVNGVGKNSQNGGRSRNTEDEATKSTSTPADTSSHEEAAMETDAATDEVKPEPIAVVGEAAAAVEKRHSADSSQGNLSILSPFDEKEEWNKISKIIDSFGDDIRTDIKESITPKNSPDVEYPTMRRKNRLDALSDWLKSLGMDKYESALVDNGYDDLDFLGDDVLDEDTLEKGLGVISKEDREAIMNKIRENKPMKALASEELSDLTLDDWLDSLNLSQYSDTFRENFFTSMDRVAAIWDDELTSILEVDKIGHRRRILVSVAGKNGLASRVGKVKVEEKMDVDDSAKETRRNISKDSPKRKEAEVKAKKAPSPAMSQSPTAKPRTTHPPTPPKPTSLSASSPARKAPSTNTTDASTAPASSTKTTTSVASTSTTASTTTATTTTATTAKPTVISTDTMGRTNTARKKKAAPQPPSASSESASRFLKGRSNSDLQEPLKKKRTAAAAAAEPLLLSSKSAEAPEKSTGSGPSGTANRPFLSYKVKYFGKRVVKDFRGNDSTKAAIEASKKMSSAKQASARYLVLTERSIKILKCDGKEVVAKHPVSVVCCIVRDKVDPPAYFGYITSDATTDRHFSHVYATGCMGKTTEILKVICEGFGPALASTKSFHQDPLTDLALESTASSQSPPRSGASSGAASTPAATSSMSRFRPSEQIVSRMKMFFQGGGAEEKAKRRRSRSPESAKREAARRKRGGSMDNLLDDLDEPIKVTSASAAAAAAASKAKSVSTKNLASFGHRKSGGDGDKGAAI